MKTFKQIAVQLLSARARSKTACMHSFCVQWAPSHLPRELFQCCCPFIASLTRACWPLTYQHAANRLSVIPFSMPARKRADTGMPSYWLTLTGPTVFVGAVCARDNCSHAERGAACIATIRRCPSPTRVCCERHDHLVHPSARMYAVQTESSPIRVYCADICTRDDNRPHAPRGATCVETLWRRTPRCNGSSNLCAALLVPGPGCPSAACVRYLNELDAHPLHVAGAFLAFGVIMN